MCILFVYNLLIVVSQNHYDFSVLSMSAMGFQTKLDKEWVSAIQFWQFFNFFNFEKPLIIPEVNVISCKQLNRFHCRPSTSISVECCEFLLRWTR